MRLNEPSRPFGLMILITTVENAASHVNVFVIVLIRHA